jgi:DNA-binding NtrC family response regulator
MDGLDFFKRIGGFNSDAIKILITAYGSKEVVAEAGKHGVQAFIEKPFTSDIIEGSLSSLIEARKSRKKGT